jgi:hypothetical protein
LALHEVAFVLSFATGLFLRTPPHYIATRVRPDIASYFEIALTILTDSVYSRFFLEAVGSLDALFLSSDAAAFDHDDIFATIEQLLIALIPELQRKLLRRFIAFLSHNFHDYDALFQGVLDFLIDTRCCKFSDEALYILSMFYLSIPSDLFLLFLVSHYRINSFLLFSLISFLSHTRFHMIH